MAQTVSSKASTLSIRWVSNLVWIGFLLIFLLLELPAKDVGGLWPWNSLSQTSWMNEQSYPWLRTILFGFLVGLAVHIRFTTGLFRATIGGVLLALAVNYLWTYKT